MIYNPGRFDQLLQQIGIDFSFEYWFDNATNHIVVEVEGNTYRLSQYELVFAKDPEVYFARWIARILADLGAKEAENYLLEPDNSPNYKRVKAINAELDILRGKVPTPDGYKVDPRRAKALMTELKKLTEMPHGAH